MEQQRPISTAFSDPSSLESTNKGPVTQEPQHLENIRTVSRVPGNDHYYEKNGLRTYGDGEDHDHEPPV